MDSNINNTFVSIIIPALNEEKNIGRCLESIGNLAFPTSQYEVILVDNGSEDKTRGIAESFNRKLDIKVLVQRAGSIGRLRNFGVRCARGNILSFLDADCTVCKEWMSQAIRDLSDISIGAAGSSHLSAEGSWVAEAWDLNIAKRRVLGDVETLPSGNLFVRRESFLQVKGFDEELITNEDYDLCFRLRAIGLRVYSDPKICAIHWGVPSDLMSFYKQQKWHGTHVFKVFLRNIREFRNFRAVSFGIYSAVCLVLFLVAVAVWLKTGDLVYAVADAMALLMPGFLLGLRAVRGQPKWYRNLGRLFVLYSVYGVARAASIFANIQSILIKEKGFYRKSWK